MSGLLCILVRVKQICGGFNLVCLWLVCVWGVARIILRARKPERLLFTFGLVVMLLGMFAAICMRVQGRTAVSAQSLAADPNAACGPCHKTIYDRYRKTPMANASGLAEGGYLAADFEHAPSGVHYRVFEQDGKVWLSYQRSDASRPLKGRQQLIYFLGSGMRGRTYLFEQEGYWFEAPINWYAKKGIWDMTPAFEGAHEMPLTLPVDPGCLHCHTSGAASSSREARNLYASAPFAFRGISCESCHGDASSHVKSAGKIRMMDIEGLAPVRRDSICLNCHLEGQVGVDREGKRPEDFRPGDNLYDYTVFFVHRAENGSGGRATSQWEALLKSQCKRKSGDRMTCTTCHDPHGDPTPSQRVDYYRGKCLQCHSSLAAQHHLENRDCTACHMGRPPSSDIAHEQVTDHWIRRRVSVARLPLITAGNLVSVGRGVAGDRDLGLAYTQMAESGDHAAADLAMKLLEKAERQTGGAAKDYELHADLGFLEQERGEPQDAAREYREALAANPDDELAAGNLALLEAQSRQIGDATELWRRVFSHDPTQTEAGFNLAVVECGAGEPGAALQTLDTILQFSPDNDRARTMAGDIRTGQRSCKKQRR